ncbi:MAG TPA: ATP-binding protein [Gemmatimonadales bacterium]|nr:ATP-binding protein [Gemmatimonadales bacterium]
MTMPVPTPALRSSPAPGGAGLLRRSWRFLRTPSISRLFAVAFLAIAVAGVARQVAFWVSARRTQSDMVELSQRLEALARFSSAPAAQAQILTMRDLAAEVGDNAIQAAVQTTVLFVIVLVALGIGLWYNRLRLAAPFAHVVGALERVAAGRYEERLGEDQPEEFGMIARGVNQMAAALGWRERLQEQEARLLTALNAPPRESAGGAGAAAGGSFGPALEVLAAATGASALALYQPQYDSNEWSPTAVRRATARPLSRDVVRRIVADANGVIQFAGAAATPVRGALQFADGAADPGGALALVPLRSRDRLVGLLVATTAGELSPDVRTALEHAAPHLAIACERESAHQHTRRLAVEVRHAAQRLESQNTALTTLNDKLEEQHRELTRLNTELDRAVRLKDQFLANVSHELRTPLNSVIGFSELLLTMEGASADAPLSDTQRDYLETIARNGRHLLELINELLDLSKIAAGRMELRLEPLELDAVLHDVATTVRAQIEARRHTLVIDPAHGGLIVTADRGRLRQVLLNLLSNAIKFTPDGGRIALSARVEDGTRVRVAVSDSGIGIAPDDQPKLFREFVQLDASNSRRYEGTGLGLALSKRLIELHGGAIGVESALGKGSTFWFTVPRVATGREGGGGGEAERRPS